MNESIISSGAFTPSNYVGTRRSQKFSDVLKSIRDPMKKRLKPLLIYNAKDLGGVGKYNPKFL